MREKKKTKKEEFPGKEIMRRRRRRRKEKRKEGRKEGENLSVSSFIRGP